MAAFQPQTNTLSRAEKLRFMVPVEFRSTLNIMECKQEIAALNWHKTGCLYTDTINAYVDDEGNTFKVAIKNRSSNSWNTIECLGRLSTLADHQTQVEGKIGFSFFYLVILCIMSALSLALLLPIPGSVSFCSRLFMPLACLTLWYFTLKQRYELLELLQTTLDGDV